MPATEHSPSQNVVELMGAVSGALKATAAKTVAASGERLKKPEVVAALLKVLHTVVASGGPANSQKVEEIGKAITCSFDSDLDAIKAFVDDKANGLQ